MRVKVQSSRSRATAWARRRRSASGSKVRPVQPENQQRMWSLLLPPGYPNQRR